MQARGVFVSLILCAVPLTACGGTTPQQADTTGTLRIARLTGSVAKFGSSQGFPLYGVRLRARVCTGLKGEIYPDFTIEHYLLVGSPTRRWILVRRVFDRPPYLVPLQETWQGRRCGPAHVDDPIPPEHAGGVEQFGNPWSCYGVRLTIWAGKRHASKRAAIQCGGIGGAVTCAPARLLTPPWVVGVRERAALARLREAGFHVDVSRALKHKPGVPGGIVLTQEPDRGMKMCRRSDISLLVSI